MVKVASPVLPLPSVMATVCVPEVAVCGTMNVVPVKDPEESVLCVPPSGRESLSHLAVMAEPWAKLEPDTWIVSPAFPFAGMRVTEGSTSK